MRNTIGRPLHESSSLLSPALRQKGAEHPFPCWSGNLNWEILSLDPSGRWRDGGWHKCVGEPRPCSLQVIPWQPKFNFAYVGVNET